MSDYQAPLFDANAVVRIVTLVKEPEIKASAKGETFAKLTYVQNMYDSDNKSYQGPPIWCSLLVFGEHVDLVEALELRKGDRISFGGYEKAIEVYTREDGSFGFRQTVFLSETMGPMEGLYSVDGPVLTVVETAEQRMERITASKKELTLDELDDVPPAGVEKTPAASPAKRSARKDWVGEARSRRG